MIDWTQLGGAATAGGIVIGGLFKLWTSIRNKFDVQDEARKTQLTDMESRVLSAFAKHEDLDQQRHTDNIKKFDKQDDVLVDIRLILARAGLNGFNKPD